MNLRRAVLPTLVALVAATGCKSCSKAPSVTPTNSSPTPTSALATWSTELPAAPPLVSGGGVGESVALPTDVAIDGTPQFSPDGKRLVFASRTGDRHQIFIADRDGRNVRRISDGKADDIDPTFGADARTVLFASNESGNYDIWRMLADGTGRKNLTNSPEDEFWPRVSPIEFRLEPKQSDGDEVRGSDTVVALKYRRVLFQRGSGAQASVWGMLEDGRFPVRISPEGLAAKHPAWSPDGLQLAFDVDRQDGTFLVVGRGRVVERDCRKKPCDPFVTFYDAKAPERAVAVSMAKALEAPKDWFAYDLRVLEATRGCAFPVFFANQTALLAVRQDGNSELRAVDFDGGASVLLARDVRSGSAPAFSPLGNEIAFAGSGTPNGSLNLAASRFYLSEALNLHLYPELVRSKPAKLPQNRFVVVPGTEREFFHLLEKARYAKKGVFVSADAVVQLVHDLMEANVQRAERDLAHSLADLDRKLLGAAVGESLAASAEARRDAEDLAVHLAVPAVLLGEVSAATRKKESDGSTDPVKIPPEEVLLRLKLPPSLEKRVRENVERVYAAKEMVGTIDYTRFAPRGHYDDDGVLASYFRAVTWFGTVPLGPPDRPGPWLLAWRLMRQHGLFGQWERLDASATLFAGPPEDPSFRDLAATAERDANAGNATDGEGARAVMAGVVASRPANRVGGSAIVEAKTTEEARRLALTKQLYFLPQRAPPDAAWLTALTTPFVKGRQYPDPLDIMAALGSPRARELLGKGELASPGAQPYADTLRAALDSVALEGKRLMARAEMPDLATGWLRTIALLSSPSATTDGSGTLPAFSTSEGWKDKSLVSAVAAYTLYKHAAVLYAKQPYAAEAGEGGEDLSFWKEVPVEKLVRGYIEPHPRLYAWMAKMARQFEAIAPPRHDTDKGRAPALFEKLRVISEKELAIRPLTPDEYAWIDEAGAAIEHFYVYDGNGEIDRSPDRLQYGVKVVADILTNLNEGKVLELGTGDVNTLYVITPHGGEQLLAQGGAHGVYVFTQPMAQRLNDKAWGELVDAGKQPAPPAWTQSFVETLK